MRSHLASCNTCARSTFVAFVISFAGNAFHQLTMALESCMILLDCSEYMRNGDYVPTRLEAQKDAANLLIGAKTQMNPETSVGVSAGTELLLSPTADVGKILGAIHGLQFQPSSVHVPPAASSKPSAPAASADQSNITSAVQVASLALKHRPNKNGAQRIVLFVGTPVTADARALQKAGRALKKNNIAIDVVALGELEENEAKLRELVDAANGSSGDGQARTCHLVTIPPGGGVLVSDVLASSPILGQGAFAASAAAASMSMGAGVGAGGGVGGGMNDFSEYGGVDPSLDPELAMALRVSMEEERLRQERIAAAAATAAAQQQQQAEESKDADMDEAAAAAGLSEEEALLQQALAMSMNENEPTSADEGGSKPAATDDVEMEDDDEDEDAAMQMALQMSLQQQQEPASEFQDPNFINQMLGSMPGVDPNDPEIQEALRKAQEKKEGDSGDKDESK